MFVLYLFLFRFLIHLCVAAPRKEPNKHTLIYLFVSHKLENGS